jgi:N-acetylmuramoyl-L-alanine amidase
MTLCRQISLRLGASLLLAASCLGGARVASAQAAWQVLKYDGRDYLSMRNVADFYKLQYSQAGKSVTLQSPGCTVRGDVGSKELIINGVKFIMSSDLVDSGDNVLLSRLDLTKLLEPVLRPNRIRGTEPIRTVVIDPGHGGYDRGATSIYGDEKSFALDTSLRLRELLIRRGLNVEMTRSTDVFIPLEERAAFANRFRDGIFVCIHYNAGSDSGTGIETYTLAPRFVPSTGDDSPTASCMIPCAGNVEDPENMALATAMHAALLSRLPMVDRGIKRARFCVLRLTTIPAVLIEGGFVSNVQEASRIATPAYRQAEAEAIALAIQNYMTATNAGPRLPILAGATPEHSPLSLPPGSLQMQDGIPSIGAAGAMNSLASQVNNMQDGPTVVVPRSN